MGRKNPEKSTFSADLLKPSPIIQASDHHEFGVGLRGSKPIVQISTAGRKLHLSPPASPNVAAEKEKRSTQSHFDMNTATTSADTESAHSSHFSKQQPTTGIVPKVNFDDLCLQHVVGGGGFGQVNYTLECF